MFTDKYQEDRDPNFIAYQKMSDEGVFSELPDKTYVAFHEGNWVGAGIEIGALIQELRGSGLDGPLLLHLAKAPIQTVRIRHRIRIVPGLD